MKHSPLDCFPRDRRPFTGSEFFPAVALLLILSSAAVRSQTDDDDFQVARNLFRDTGDYATASELFAEFIRNYPRSTNLADARLMLARSLAHSDRCGPAIGAYEDFYQEYPEHLSSHEARLERAACLESEGDHLRAAEAYGDVQRLYRASEFAPRALLDAARSYTRAGSLEDATHAYHNLLEEYATDILAQVGRYRLAGLHLAGGDGEGAQRLLAQITTQAPASSESRDALLLSGRIYLFLGRTDEAVEAFDQLRRSFPDSPHADSTHVDLATHLFKRGNYAPAARVFRAARKDIADESLKSKAGLGLADALRYGGDHSTAVEVYGELLAEVAPGSELFSRARLGLAVSNGHSGKFSESVGIFLELIHSRPGQTATDETGVTAHAAAARRQLAALYRRRGDLARSMTWFRDYLDEAERAGEAFPEATIRQQQVRLQLGQVYDTAGYHREAIQLLRALTDVPALAADASYSLARAYEHAESGRLALLEYEALIERFPGHPHTDRSRERVEYLREFTVLDPDGRNRQLQQALIGMLSGRSHRGIQFDLARALRRHRDYENAVAVLETYVASYPEDPTAPEAQFYLAESLHRLSRQRQLEGRGGVADSLDQLYRQELRILARAEPGDLWTRRAQLQLVVADSQVAETDSSRLRILVGGLSDFLAVVSGEPAASGQDGQAEVTAEALLRRGEALLELSADDPGQLTAAMFSFDELLQRFPTSPLALQARFGSAVVRGRQGDASAATDSLNALLRDIPGLPLVPRVLFELGTALQVQGLRRAATAQFQELLLAYPAFPRHRDVQEILADTHFELGEFTRAIRLYTRLAHTDANGDGDGRLQRRIALSLHRSGQLQDALDLYTRLLQNPLDVSDADSMRFDRARLLAQLGRADEAVDEFALLRERHPDSELAPLAARLSGHILFDSGRYADALAVYEPLVAGGEGGDEEAARSTAGRAVLARYRLDRLKEAGDSAKAFARRFGKTSPWNHIFLLEEGRLLLRSHDFEKATKLFGQVEEVAGNADMESFAETDHQLRQLAAEPAASAAYYAATSLWQQNSADPSEELANRAVQAQLTFIGRHPDSPLAADVNLRMAGYEYHVLDRFLQAAGHYRKALEGRSNLDQQRIAIYQLLQCYEKLNEFDQAHRTALRLLREYRQHPKLRNVQLQIGALLQDMGRNVEAIAYLERVLDWAEGDEAAEARYLIGKAYQTMGQYREAINRYYRVSFHGSGSNTLWITSADYQRAQCNEELGEYATAARIYERIIQREGSGSSFGKAARNRLELLPEH